MKDPLVSVLMITFNQSKYIATALDSVLNQRTSFPVEIVIGDDASTDGTSDIIRRYCHQYPERITALFHPNNLGSRGNFRKVFERCRGKYLAILEGDDQWTRDDKLEKQVSFLESHPDCSIVGGYAVIEREGSETTYSDVLPRPQMVSFFDHRLGSIEDLICCYFIHTSCIMYRNIFKGRFPSLPDSVLSGDWLLAIHHALHGRIGFIPEPLSIWHQHSGSWFYGIEEIKRARADLHFYQHLMQLLPSRFRKLISTQILHRRRRLVVLLESQKQYTEARKQLLSLWRERGWRLGIKEFTKLNLRLVLPNAFGSLNRLANSTTAKSKTL